MLNKCTLTLIKKVKPEEYKPPTATSSKDNDKPKEQVFLEKTKPPKFNGDVLEFAEFKRKWMAQVNKANLPEESELDKLRDNIPREAKERRCCSRVFAGVGRARHFEASGGLRCCAPVGIHAHFSIAPGAVW